MSLQSRTLDRLLSTWGGLHRGNEVGRGVKFRQLCSAELLILRVFSAAVTTAQPTLAKRKQFPGLQWVLHLFEHMKKMGMRKAVVCSYAAFELLWEGALTLLREGGAQDRLVFAHRKKVRLFTPLAAS
mgnify:CR=1 FL=1